LELFIVILLAFLLDGAGPAGAMLEVST